MKHLLAALLCLLLLPTTACAKVIAHRYVIPETAYSIEVPRGWHVLSREMDGHEPSIYEIGIDYVEDMEFMKNSGFSMFAKYPGDSSLLMFVEVKKYPESTSYITQNLTKSELDEMAALLYGEFSSTSPENEGVYAFGIQYENINYIYWQYPVLSETGNKFSITEHFIVSESDYLFDISFSHDTNDAAIYAENFELVDFITKSAMKH